MNLGQAVAVCLYELIRNGKLRGGVDKSRAATADGIERITTLLLEVLLASGYVSPRPPGPTEEKMRRLVRRMNLVQTDAEAWLGMLRQILWKVKKSN